MKRGMLRFPDATAQPMPKAALLPLLAVALATTAIVACHTTPATGPKAVAGQQVLLLGETHDNGEGHRLRAEALRARVDAGWRPAIAMEQFDREQQPALDAAMRECGDADCVIGKVVTPNASIAKSGWQWPFYKPVIALAVEYKLPLLAANLSRADAGRVVAEGMAALGPELTAAYGLDHPLNADLLQPQVAEVREGHCNMLPPEMLEPMASAQIARDITMAEVMRPFADTGVVLIAGNGHVRRDIGVPYWLRSFGIEGRSIGYVEDTPTAGEFDEAHVVPAIERPDPCAKFKAPAPPAAPAAAPAPR